MSRTRWSRGWLAGIAVAAERIDLTTHQGVHPRVGAADVVPFVRFRPGDPEPARAARALGERIGALGIPVVGYGELGGGRRPGVLPPRRHRPGCRR